MAKGQKVTMCGALGQARQELAAILLDTKMNVLLLLLPLAIVSRHLGWPAGATFVLSLLPLCSLAERLGLITEQLAMYTNDTLGGLLNATFGNATEVIIAGFAISKGYLRIVKLTLLGSVVSNLLLVMGSAFVAGGILHKQQTFNREGIAVNCGLLVVAVVSVALPTLLSSTDSAITNSHAELVLSRVESVLMLVCYLLFLVFQLCTHRHLYEDGDGGSQAEADGLSKKNSCSNCGAAPAAPPLPPPPPSSGWRTPPLPAELELVEAPPVAAAAGIAAPQQQPQPRVRRGASSRELGAGVAGGVSSSFDATSGRQAPSGCLPERSGEIRVEVATLESLVAEEEDESEHAGLVRGGAAPPRDTLKFEAEEDDEQVLSWPGCLFWLSLITLFISLLSDYIMDAIKEASLQLGVPMPFLATIVVPIVGNAAEHASALMFAARNRMEIALGVAVGSSTQVAVLLVPFCVLLAWAMGQPLDLNFADFEALVLFVAVLLAVVVMQDGTSNWLKGAMLVLTYFFIAAGFWVHKDADLNAEQLHRRALL